jgi:hypothetical protein
MCNCARRRAVGGGGGGGRAVGGGGARGVRTPPSPRVPVRRAPARMFNGMPIVDPAIWGPAMWFVLHGLAALAPAADPDWPALLDALTTSLPCPDCAGHYTQWRRRTLLRQNSDDGVRQWLLDLHNSVNRRRGVAQWSIDQLRAEYGGVDVAVVRERIEGLRGVCGAAALDVAARMVERIVAAAAGPV